MPDPSPTAAAVMVGGARDSSAPATTQLLAVRIERREGCPRSEVHEWGVISPEKRPGGVPKAEAPLTCRRG